MKGALVALGVLALFTSAGWCAGRCKASYRARPVPDVAGEVTALEPRLYWGRERVEHWKGVAAVANPERMRQ